MSTDSRTNPPQAAATHPVLHTTVDHQPTGNQAVIYLAGGCFWGFEKILWQTPGVVATAVGYTGGATENPNYAMVCTGTTGHAEAVRGVYDREQISDQELLAVFWQNHDPTQLNRQGNDIGTQYRSAIWTTDDQQAEAVEEVRGLYQTELTKAGHGKISSTSRKFASSQRFFVAEDYHQAYLWKNPQGYCNHGFNGVECPSGLTTD